VELRAERDNCKTDATVANKHASKRAEIIAKMQEELAFVDVKEAQKAGFGDTLPELLSFYRWMCGQNRDKLIDERDAAIAELVWVNDAVTGEKTAPGSLLKALLDVRVACAERDAARAEAAACAAAPWQRRDTDRCGYCTEVLGLCKKGNIRLVRTPLPLDIVYFAQLRPAPEGDSCAD